MNGLPPKSPSFQPRRSSPLSSPPSSPALRPAGAPNQVNETNHHDNIVTYFLNDAGQRHGPYTVHSRRGRLIEKHAYTNGLLDGVGEMYYDSGNLMVLCHFRAGRLDGDYKRWSPNGQLLSHERFVGGQREGLQESWHLETGALFQRYYMLGNRKHGLYQLFDASGNPVEEYNYRTGVLHGSAHVHLKDGRICVTVYDSGRPVSKTIQHPDDVRFDAAAIAKI